MGLISFETPPKWLFFLVCFLGSVPDWLDGTLYRNGPGKLYHGEESFRHLFDGDAILQAFRITKDGTVTYASKFLQSDAYKANKDANRIAAVTFGSSPADANESGLD